MSLAHGLAQHAPAETYEGCFWRVLLLAHIMLLRGTKASVFGLVILASATSFARLLACAERHTHNIVSSMPAWDVTALGTSPLPRFRAIDFALSVLL